MASRAEGQKALSSDSVPVAALRPSVAVKPPRLGAVFRASLTDYYFNSMRLVPVNVAWGAGVVLIIVIGLAWPLGALLLIPILVLPTAAVFRVAAIVVRGDPWSGLREVVGASRHELPAMLALGAAFVATGLILATNVLTGLSQGEPVGWVLATLAAWGLVAWWCLTIVAWPLIVDPTRATQPLRKRLRLAASLLLVHPLRFGALGLAVAFIVVLSTILTAAILTVSVALVALVACRFVYPAADRLEIALAGERS